MRGMCRKKLNSISIKVLFFYISPFCKPDRQTDGYNIYRKKLKNLVSDRLRINIIINLAIITIKRPGVVHFLFKDMAHNIT